ncbi:DUF3263 domain-containing protein [Brachybacterium paraconglomeratum]|uniref:DUF3263 domain-containing protein n=1 Tax=Brachybacterium paraconglomeratum TaxID=173362 RepID=UPI0031F0C858
MPSDPSHRASRAAPAAAEVAAEVEPARDTPAAMSDVSLPGPQGGLSDRDRRILALEGRTFRYVGAKERAIREQIGLSKVAYYVRLNALLDEPAALRAAPSVVHRLRGRRTSEDGAAGADDTHRVA